MVLEGVPISTYPHQKSNCEPVERVEGEVEVEGELSEDRKSVGV